MRSMVWTLLIATVSFSQAANGQAASPRFNRLADSLQRLVDARVVPSVAVAIVDRDGILWERGFGLADIEGGIATTPGTAYPVASVAKSLTAIAAMRAVDRGLLDLDRPVDRYLGDSAITVIEGDRRRLTTRTLLQMTGGIPHLVRFRWPDSPADSAVHGPLAHFTAFAPGEHFHYSNNSMGIVGEILERISGASFERYMQAEVFGPLRLESSAVRGADLALAKVAQTYSGTPFHRANFVRLEPEAGAGMFTSAHDLALVARAIFLSPDTTFLSTRSRALFRTFDAFPYYSLGWWGDPFRPAGTTLVADGAAYGHSATMKIMPDAGIAAVILVNSTAPNGFTLGLSDFALRVADSTLSAPSADVPAGFIPTPVGRDTTYIGRWTGTLRIPGGTVPVHWTVDADGKTSGVIGNGPPAPVSGAEVGDGLLETNIGGALPLSATAGQPHRLRMNLRRRGSALVGYVTASTSLGDRPFFVIPFPVCLERQGGRKAAAHSRNCLRQRRATK